MDQYIEIQNLSDPQSVYERLENLFIDIMYPAGFTNRSVTMLLDVGFDPFKAEDIAWLKELLDAVLPEMGETQYSLTPCTQ